ncbi:MAG: GNAT family N-acetyltransferase [Rhodomicrobiaceae bacterium]
MTRIVALSEMDAGAEMRSEVEAIFFAGAATQAFSSTEARDAYRDLWLGRYMRAFPELFLVALDDDGRAAGYLAGSPVSDATPLPGPDYYRLFPRTLIEACPAHLHVNIRADLRRRGLGEMLIAAFRRECISRGLPGFHAVTAAESRAAHFFARCGLAPLERTVWNERSIVFLGEHAPV